MPKVINAYVHTQRGTVRVNGVTAAYIRLPGPGNMNAEGMQVTTTVLTDRQTCAEYPPGVPQAVVDVDYRSGDILCVDERVDFATPGQVTQYTIQKPYPSGTGHRALWRVEIAGAIR